MSDSDRDFIDWDLITRYLGGMAAPPERAQVEQWLAESPDHWSLLNAMREVGKDADDIAIAPAEWKATVLDVLRRREVVPEPVTDAEPQQVGAARSRTSSAVRFAVLGRRRSFVGIAAGFALVVAGGAAAGWLALHRPPRAAAGAEHPAFSIISTAPGQRLSLRLSDGTLVSLAPGSTLRTPADYGRRDRAVELQGEAAFTVTHDSTRPFAVRTPRAVATDLGTRFVVRAYADDPATDIVVAEGRVAVRQAMTTGRPLPADSLILGWRERARVAGDGHLEFTRGIALDDYFAWTEGKLIFEGTPLREAARRLGRWYDIDVRLEPGTIGDRRLFAAVENEPATDVLRTIATSLDLRLSRAGRVFTLTAN